MTHGLMRVRTFCQDDAHIFCTPDQIEDEIHKVTKMIFDTYDRFQMSASQLFSKSKWLRVHCADCRPADFPELVKRFIQDFPGFVGTGAALGACNASGALSNKACFGAVNAFLDSGVRAGIALIRKDKQGFHWMDQIAGKSLMAVLWDSILPRGLAPFEGTATSCRVGNGIAEVLGEPLISTANQVAIDSISRVLHSEPVNIRDRLVDGLIYAGIPAGVEHLTLVLTVGTRFRLSEQDRGRILNYAAARTGWNNASALDHSDIRLEPSYAPEGGLFAGRAGTSYWGLTLGLPFANSPQVLLSKGVQEAGQDHFLITIAHEAMHIRQYQVLGILPDLKLGISNESILEHHTGDTLGPKYFAHGAAATM